MAATLKATMTNRTKEGAEATERMRKAPMSRYSQTHNVIHVKPRDANKDIVK
jgi:hypothetical protein